MNICDIIAEMLRLDERMWIAESLENKSISLMINYVSHFLYLVESTTTAMDIYTIEHWNKELPMFLKSCEDAINEIPGRNKKEKIENYIPYIFKKSIQELMKKFNYQKEFEIKNEYIKELIDLNRFGNVELEQLGLNVEKLKNNKVKLHKLIINENQKRNR